VCAFAYVFTSIVFAFCIGVLGWIVVDLGKAPKRREQLQGQRHRAQRPDEA
jgi:hypothetical protein